MRVILDYCMIYEIRIPINIDFHILAEASRNRPRKMIIRKHQLCQALQAP